MFNIHNLNLIFIFKTKRYIEKFAVMKTKSKFKSRLKSDYKFFFLFGRQTRSRLYSVHARRDVRGIASIVAALVTFMKDVYRSDGILVMHQTHVNLTSTCHGVCLTAYNKLIGLLNISQRY